jgi:hypothetical protein
VLKPAELAAIPGVARAAILHLLELIEYRERRRDGDDSKIGVMYLHAHHWIRGEE